MKAVKIITTLFIMTLILVQVSAQGMLYYQEAKTFEFGPRIGFTTSILSVDDDSLLGKRKIRLSYVLGLFGRYQLNERWSLQGDVVYASRGGDFENSDEVELNYIDIPITVVYNVRFKLKDKPFTFDVFAGIQPSFLSKAKIGGVEVTDSIEKTGVDLVFGSGFPIWKFLFYSTIKIGLTDLNKGFPTETSNSLNSISTEWTVGYRINGK